MDSPGRRCTAFARGRALRWQHGHSVRLDESKWFPSNGELPHIVQTRLRQGERTTVLDLAGVSSIDAAGIGELVRAYNIAIASHGTLRISNPNRWVREMLERVGLFDRLNTGDRQDRERGDEREVVGA